MKREREREREEGGREEGWFDYIITPPPSPPLAERKSFHQIMRGTCHAMRGNKNISFLEEMHFKNNYP